MAVLLPNWGAVIAQEQVKQILFLGDQGHHQPAQRFQLLQPVLESRGIELTYSENMDHLDPEFLDPFDGLIVYSNQTQISESQEAALIDFVESGKGFIPIHCASYCFLNSERYVELVGAQFQRHGTGIFRTSIGNTEHPIMSGFGGFESWDETYVHHRHFETNRIVLSYRVDGEGAEPWTWIRTQGDGRVFYTAWGHDHRTWSNPGFHNLIERGIRWAIRDDVSQVPEFSDPSFFPLPEMQPLSDDVEPFDYMEAEIPFYPPSRQWGVIGEPLREMQKPLPAEESIKHYTVPVGFELQLFAADPDIKKPICMNWDERGRLWIAETIDYPNEKRAPGEGRDQIKICEDTDGDGAADKFTVFADQLSIPTSLIFANGGVIVHQAPETLFLKDTDGDDVADVREVLFRGWSVNDTHAGPSNMVYGHDNWIWGIVGYAGFRGTVGEEEHSFRTGFYRFAPDGSKIEFLRNTDNNSWGVGFNEEGVLFGSTANRNPSVYMPIPNRYYEAVRGWSSSVLGSIADSYLFSPITEKVRQVDQHGGYTAAAGHALYTAREWPREYWNRTAFVTGSTGHLVGTFVITPQGSDFKSTSPFNILAGDDEWAAPIMAEVGPDGQLWVLDWYNYIVQHNPTPAGYQTGRGNAYESDLRDKRHGRVYRIVHESSAPAEAIDLSAADPSTLVEHLSDGNLFWRRHAQRLLVEGGHRDVASQLLALLNDQAIDEVGLNVGAIHALWTLHGLGLTDGADKEINEAIYRSLGHPSSGVRRNALQVLPPLRESMAAIINHRLIEDKDAQVRLAAFLALADLELSHDVSVSSTERDDSGASEAIVNALLAGENATDRWIPDAATAAAAGQGKSFLIAALQSQQANANDGNRTALVSSLRIVAEHVTRGTERGRLDGVFVAMQGSRPELIMATLDGITGGWSEDRAVKMSDEDDAVLRDIVELLPTNARGGLVVLAGRMGSDRLASYAGEIAESLLEIVNDDKLPDAERIDASRRLIDFLPDDQNNIAEMLEMVSPQISIDLSTGILEAMRGSNSESTGIAIVSRVGEWTPATRSVALRVLLSRPAWTSSLLDGLEAGELTLNDLALDQKQALIAHPSERIAARMQAVLDSGGVMLNSDRTEVIERLHYVTEELGNPTVGAAVFEKHCSKCHMHSGKGTNIGPDLTGMAVHPKEELLTQILDPSQSVEGNFRSYTVLTLDGIVINGLLASETRTTIELFDTEGEKQVVLREDIDELVVSDKSLMPEGFEEQLKPEELRDLLAFLTQRGRFVPIPIDRVATSVSTKGMFFTEESTVERLVFPDWSPKEFSGVPFVLVDPQGDRIPNTIMLNGPNGRFPPRMPRSVSLPVNGAAKSIHLLSGVSGWGAKSPRDDGPVSMIVRLYYEDGEVEDHPLRDGFHFADYIGEFDVPGSELAFSLNGRQIRYLSVEPSESKVIERIEFVKGPDSSAPIVMAVTIESITTD